MIFGTSLFINLLSMTQSQPALLSDPLSLTRYIQDESTLFHQQLGLILKEIFEYCTSDALQIFFKQSVTFARHLYKEYLRGTAKVIKSNEKEVTPPHQNHYQYEPLIQQYSQTSQINEEFIYGKQVEENPRNTGQNQSSQQEYQNKQRQGGILVNLYSEEYKKKKKQRAAAIQQEQEKERSEVVCKQQLINWDKVFTKQKVDIIQGLARRIQKNEKYFLKIYEQQCSKLQSWFVSQAKNKIQFLHLQTQIEKLFKTTNRLLMSLNQKISNLYNSEIVRIRGIIDKIVHISAITKGQSIQQLLNQIDKLKDQLQQRILNYAQQCYRHRNEVKYFSKNEYIPKKKYLCEQCMINIAGRNDLSHQIMCKEHNQPVTYEERRIYQEQEITISQQFLCRKCREAENGSKSVNLITTCHFVPIVDICIEPKCIQLDNFKLCPCCPSEHEGHRIIPFTRQSLIDSFGKANNDDDDVSTYQSLYLSILEKIKLQSIKKAIDSHMLRHWSFARFIQAFAVHSNKQLEEWSDMVLEKGEKEDVFVLWAVGELKRRELGGKEKKKFLEAINDKLGEELETLINGIEEQMLKFIKFFGKLIEMEQDEIQDYLDHKYREIVNVRSEGREQGLIYFQDVAEQHLDRIVKLEIDREDEQPINAFENRQAAIKQLLIYKFEDMCRKYKISKKNRIETLLLSHHYGRTLFSKANVNIYAIEQLRQSLRQVQDIFKSQSKIFPGMNIVLSHKLTRLQVLRLCHKSNKLKQLKEFQQPKYDYCIDAFKLFEAVQCMRALRELKIIGIEVQKIQQFTNQCRRAADLSLSASGSLNHCNSIEWLRQFQPSAVVLNINATFIFNVGSNSLAEEMADASYFFGIFRSVGYITAKIIIMKQDIESIVEKMKKIIIVLAPINIINISIEYKPKINSIWFDDKGVAFFETLSMVKSINQLAFKNIKISSYRAQYIGNAIKSFISSSFITSLTIDNCHNFPIIILPSSIKNFSTKQFGDKNIKQMISNTSLQMLNLDISFRQKTVNLSKLTALTALYIHTFQLKSSTFSTLPGHSLKVLHIKSWKTSIFLTQPLKELFVRLINLTELKISQREFDGSLLQLIASHNLRKIQLISASSITNEDIWAVDCKWPYLTHLTIIDCKPVDGKIFGKCKFRGLLELGISGWLVKESDYCLEYLLKRGIKVQIHY